jgi:actin-like ATPase involved in cell morphogenesis
MTERARPALGLSVGATNLAAVTADHAFTRKPVLTLYRKRPPEVGVPSENPRLDEPGLVISDFVDRVGHPVGILAADGSMHRSEALVADGLRALAYAATGGRTLPESVAVTYPAHWGSPAVDALGSALSRVAEWSKHARPVTMIPDAAAILFAVRANPGIPARGTVVVCDFGGSGTSITLMDAGDYRPLAATVRHHDFSGDLIDQALLTAVMDNLPGAGSFDLSGTWAIGSLSRLRSGCRSAKEQLSSSTVATLGDELPGVRGDIRLTRNELDDAIRDSLNNFVAVLDETLARNGIRDLVAVVSVGGGANIPSVTIMLSGHLRVPVVTTPRPQLTAAIGAALRAARGPGDTSPTVLHPASPQTSSALMPLVPEGEKSGNTAAPLSGAISTAMPALAWSETDDSRVLPTGAGEQPKSGGGSGYTSARPALNFERKARPRSAKLSEKKDPVIPWYRVPAVLIIGTAVAVLLVGIAVAMGLGSDSKPATTPSTTPLPSAPATQPAPASQPPDTGQTQQAPPAQSTVTAPSTTSAPPPATTDTPTTVPPAAPEAPAANPALRRDQLSKATKRLAQPSSPLFSCFASSWSSLFQALSFSICSFLALASSFSP